MLIRVLIVFLYASQPLAQAPPPVNPALITTFAQSIAQRIAFWTNGVGRFEDVRSFVSQTSPLDTPLNGTALLQHV